MSNKDINKENLSQYTESPKKSNMEKSTLEDHMVFSSAELNTRALAFFIDLAIVSILALVAYGIGVYFLQVASVDSENAFMTIYLLLFFLASAYFVVLNGYSGRTIGKMLMGIRIISVDGATIGFWQSFVRWIGYYISGIFLFIGFLWSIIDRNSQSWHDKLAGTFVIKD